MPGRSGERPDFCLSTPVQSEMLSAPLRPTRFLLPRGLQMTLPAPPPDSMTAGQRAVTRGNLKVLRKRGHPVLLLWGTLNNREASRVRI